MCLLKHKWKTELIRKGAITEMGEPVGYYESYRMTCTKCGKVKLKKVSY